MGKVRNAVVITDTRQSSVARTIAASKPIGFQNSRRFRELVELAETMHETAYRAGQGGNVRASVVQMYAHELLRIIHRTYRTHRR